MLTFPGTSIEVSSLHEGASRALFDGVFATGGITLSQVSIMTGLEPYQIQNWVKRGFLTSPIKRVYSREQFARIVIINMLRDSIQIEKICSMLAAVCTDPKNPGSAWISNDALYHLYVDMISDPRIRLTDPDEIIPITNEASLHFSERSEGERKTLSGILQAMFFAHTASRLQTLSHEALFTIL